MKFLVFALFLFFNLKYSVAQVLAKIGNEKLTVQEFLWGYKKNNIHPAYTENELRDYLDRYINYRLKALDAKTLKMNEEDSFKSELGGYRDKLMQSNLKPKAGNKNKAGQEFEYLMNEYSNGILLFNLSEKKVWQYSQDDKAGLNEFYSRNKSLYNGSLKDNKALVLSDYQKFLDEKWLAYLHKTYSVVVYEDQLYKLIK